MTLLTKQEIIQALEKLGELARAQGHSVELLLVGGAAMVLMYNARPSTHDVDVLILAPRQARIVRDLAKQVAQEYNFPEDWLNDGAKGYLVGVSAGAIIFSAPGIVVRTPAIAQLLAMKLSAWRDDVDIEDARQLLQTIEGKQEEIWAAIESHLVPGTELKARYAFLDLWEALYGTD
jgi:hypothetical protein